MARRAWITYLAGGSALLTAYVFIPPIRQGPVFNLIGLSAAVAILLGVRTHRPRQPLAWYLVSIGLMLFVCGDVITYNYRAFFGTEPPFPSLGDPLYLSVYPFLVCGILLLIRRRSPGRDRASLIDSLIVTVGVGVISWVFLIAPYVHDPSLTLVEKLTAMGYPTMDLILLMVAVRLAVGGGRRPAAFYLLVASLALLFVTDSVYGWTVLHGSYDNGTGLLEWGWGFFYLLLGASACHPSIVDLDEPSPDQVLKNPRRRLLLLAGASLMVPTVQFFLSIRQDPFDVAVLAGCSAVLFVLVLVRLRGLMVDITEFRRTERQLREAEAKYRSLVEGLPAVVYVADFGKDAAWRYISPQIESVLGFTQAEWIGRPELWRERIVPEDRDRALNAELELIEGDGRMQCEYRILGGDGRVVWIREEAEALEDEAGNPVLLQGVMYDITAQKRSEAQLVRALDTEKAASGRLRMLQEMQNSFLQAVSHDLRTPLTSILGCALTLEADEGDISPEDAKDLLGRIASNSRKLSRLVTNLLDLDRIARGVVEPKREVVNVTSIIESVLEEIVAVSHPIELLARQEVLAEVDGAQVERIVENLLTNAVRYTPAGTPIWVDATANADGLLLTVDDAGPGILPELRDTVFEPFRQGNEVLSHSPGVGIGLSLVARFATLHGGRAWVQERSGGGASFRVHLPFDSSFNDRAQTARRAIVRNGMGQGLGDTFAERAPVE